ncbi:hypothetical protein GWI33_015710 [Rhynchophorus ferrugineus]|uniref:Uncharacterized protein n=1 Tax=Rhynchophorus ferrugineus TaxID=354439 RepID=A0A834M9G2_RHYFE|nr:hypothetical protein GWI33_015710 [Rhynchophorus ferrugineus]
MHFRRLLFEAGSPVPPPPSSDCAEVFSRCSQIKIYIIGAPGPTKPGPFFVGDIKAYKFVPLDLRPDGGGGGGRPCEAGLPSRYRRCKIRP